jgi:hypothetical protein
VESDHESEETNSRNPVPAIKPQHYVATDINKLRNRWCDLLHEKRVNDSLERQLEEEDDMVLIPSSESSGEPLKEDLVETAFRDNQALESSFPLHRAVFEDDEKRFVSYFGKVKFIGSNSLWNRGNL